MMFQAREHHQKEVPVRTLRNMPKNGGGYGLLHALSQVYSYSDWVISSAQGRETNYFGNLVVRIPRYSLLV